MGYFEREYDERNEGEEYIFTGGRNTVID